MSHGVAEPFYCSFKNCKYQTKWQNLLYLHMRQAHATRYFMPRSTRKPISPGPTPKCKSKTLPEIRVQPHEQKVSPKDFPRPANNMTSNAISKSDPKPVKDPNSNIFRCPFPSCGFKTLYEWNMTRRFKTHKKLSTSAYSCSKCHGKFFNQSSFELII